MSTAHDTWFLDTGASNHMTGYISVFAELDTAVSGSVKFGDGSVVEIKGRDTVHFTCRRGEHRALTGVYFIPRMRNNIVSLGQLDENGCPSAIRNGFMSLWDRSNRLLAKVPRSPNRLYKVNLQVVQPVCLSLRSGDSSWT
jgi:hypothetical protein